MAESRGNSGAAAGPAPRLPGPFSPLIRRILAVNVIALAILGGGILYLNQFRLGLIESRMEDLTAHAEIIAAAVGESAASGPEGDNIVVEPARQIIGRLVGRSDNRARLFSREGELLADSRFMDLGRSVYVIPLLPPGETPPLLERLTRWANDRLDEFATRSDLPLYQERMQQTAFDYDEAIAALDGATATMLRQQSNGVQVMSVAVPVQHFRRVLGVLLLTTEISDIQQIVHAERMNILKVFGASLGVTLLLSFFLAGTIARPIRRLAAAADLVRGGIGRSTALLEFSDRRDEIGTLSRSLSDMTKALYHQLDAVERFAADVAHELKNPLSSLRSAVETVQRSKDDAVKEKMLALIQEDITRLDRLISDISDASRLDSELSRSKMEPVDLKAMVETLVDVYKSTGRDNKIALRFETDGADDYRVGGIESRLGQVIRNLLDNAISFSPKDGTVDLKLRRAKGVIELSIEDEGPGLPENAEDKIFERFYSERPKGEAFGTHSGLGLNISRQIIEAHSGTLRAKNRQGGASGARFTIRLPHL